MADDDAQELIAGHRAMHHQIERHQHPGQIRGGEDQEAHQGEPGVRVPPAPDVDEGAGEGGAEEGQGAGREEGRREQEQRGRGVQQEPGEGGRGGAETGLEQARVPLQEEQVEQQVEAERAEVGECGEQAPILETNSSVRAESSRSGGPRVTCDLT